MIATKKAIGRLVAHKRSPSTHHFCLNFYTRLYYLLIMLLKQISCFKERVRELTFLIWNNFSHDIYDEWRNILELTFFGQKFNNILILPGSRSKKWKGIRNFYKRDSFIKKDRKKSCPQAMKCRKENKVLFKDEQIFWYISGLMLLEQNLRGGMSTDGAVIFWLMVLEIKVSYNMMFERPTKTLVTECGRVHAFE